MKKILLMAICISATCIAFSQMVKTKDGMSLGDKSEFMKACSSGGSGTTKIKGVEINLTDYCSCVCDNLIPTLTSDEVMYALKENKLTELFTSEKNMKMILACLEGNYNLKDDFKFQDMKDNKEVIQVAIKSCKDEILSDTSSSGIWTERMAEDYCSCAINKFFDKGYTYKDLQEIENENSAAFNEVAIPCVQEVLGMNAVDSALSPIYNSYDINDIIGGKSSVAIPLTDYLGTGYKIKMTIGGITRYFLLDTGASDMLIDRDLERELLINGSLKKEDYLEKIKYSLATNQQVEVQLVRISNIKVGEYTVNNVVVGVLEEGSLLCGKGFFDKFKKWEINKEKNQLILYKK